MARPAIGITAFSLATWDLCRLMEALSRPRMKRVERPRVHPDRGDELSTGAAGKDGANIHALQ